MSAIIITASIGAKTKQILWPLTRRSNNLLCNFDDFKSTLQKTIVSPILAIEYTNNKTNLPINQTGQLFAAMTSSKTPDFKVKLTVSELVILWDYNTLPLPFGVTTDKCSKVLVNLFDHVGGYYNCRIFVNASEHIHHRCYDLKIPGAKIESAPLGFEFKTDKIIRPIKTIY